MAKPERSHPVQKYNKNNKPGFTRMLLDISVPAEACEALDAALRRNNQSRRSWFAQQVTGWFDRQQTPGAPAPAHGVGQSPLFTAAAVQDIVQVLVGLHAELHAIRVSVRRESSPADIERATRIADEASQSILGG